MCQVFFRGLSLIVFCLLSLPSQSVAVPINIFGDMNGDPQTDVAVSLVPTPVGGFTSTFATIYDGNALGTGQLNNLAGDILNGSNFVVTIAGLALGPVPVGAATTGLPIVTTVNPLPGGIQILDQNNQIAFAGNFGVGTFSGVLGLPSAVISIPIVSVGGYTASQFSPTQSIMFTGQLNLGTLALLGGNIAPVSWDMTTWRISANGPSAATPEPGTVSLLLMGLIGFARVKRSEEQDAKKITSGGAGRT